jgi:ABC-2 type transport system permease protein
MRTILTVARREWLEMTRDRRAWWIALLLSVLVLSSVGIGFQQLQRLRLERDTALDVERQVWLTQERKTPHSAAHHGFYVFQPLSVLAAVDPGLLDYVGHVRRLEAHGEKLPKFTPAEDRPAIRQFPLLSAAAALQVVAPLLLVMLLHGVFAAERESGTLQMLLSSGVSPGALGLGKAIGATIPLVLSLTVAALITTAVVAFESESPTAILTRLAMGAASYGMWLVLFAGAVLFISARSRTAGQALLTSVAVWFALTILGPKLAVEAATRLHPAPTPQEFLAALREAEKSRPSYWEDLVPAARQRLLSQYGVTREEDLPMSPASMAMLDQEDDDTARVGREFERLNRIHEAQERVVGRFALFLPTLAVQRISMAASGTDARGARDFAQQAEAYRRRAVRVLNEDSAKNDTSDFLKTGIRYEAGQDLWARVPTFQYQSPSLAAVLGAHTGDALGLTVWLACLIAACLVALKHLSPA